MGIDLVSSFRYMDIIDVENIYIKIRELSTNKFRCPMEEKNLYILQYNVIYEKDGKAIQNKNFNFTREEVFVEVWADAYQHLKAELDKNEIQYTDNI